MNRRDFLKGLSGILAAGVAPAFIGSNVLMPVKRVLLPDAPILWGDGINDDTPALQAFIRGERVFRASGGVFDGYVTAATMRFESTVILSGPKRIVITSSDIISAADPVFYAPADGSVGNAIMNSRLAVVAAA